MSLRGRLRSMKEAITFSLTEAANDSGQEAFSSVAMVNGSRL